MHDLEHTRVPRYCRIHRYTDVPYPATSRRRDGFAEILLKTWQCTGRSSTSMGSWQGSNTMLDGAIPDRLEYPPELEHVGGSYELTYRLMLLQFGRPACHLG